MGYLSREKKIQPKTTVGYEHDTSGFQFGRLITHHAEFSPQTSLKVKFVWVIQVFWVQSIITWQR